MKYDDLICMMYYVIGNVDIFLLVFLGVRPSLGPCFQAQTVSVFSNVPRDILIFEGNYSTDLLH